MLVPVSKLEFSFFKQANGVSLIDAKLVGIMLTTSFRLVLVPVHLHLPVTLLCLINPAG